MVSLLDLFQTAAIDVWLLLGYIVWPAEGAEDGGTEVAAAAPDDDELMVVLRSVHDWLWSCLTGSSVVAEVLTEKQTWWESDAWGMRLQRWCLSLPALLPAFSGLTRWSRTLRSLAGCGAALSSSCALSSGFGVAGAVGPVLALVSTALHVINTAVALATAVQLCRGGDGDNRSEAGRIVPTLVTMSMWLVVGRAVVEAVLGWAGERETIPSNPMLASLDHWGGVVRPLLLALPALMLLLGNPVPLLTPVLVCTTPVCLVWRDWGPS